MATTDDIDTKAAVRKFLERRSVVNREDETADTSDEVLAVLEAVALSFLLYPQAALSFVLQGKNVLQQIASTDRDILDYLLAAISDIENPDEPITDTSDLIEAQAALVEVDRLGRVSEDVLAYDRYNRAIGRFMDRRLAKALKRHRRGELERTGPEAKQDLFRVLNIFGPTHDTLMQKLALLLNSVENFRSVELTKIVSTRTVARVRSSLNQVIRGIQKQQLSKTAIAIELLAGSSALSSISNSRDIYDPTVDTGSLPPGRSISLSSERVPAVATGSADEVSLGATSTPWVFVSVVDGINYSVTLPVSGASGRHYVKAASGSSTFNIPVGKNVLYVQFDGIAPPANEPAMVRSVSLPTGGAVTLAAILGALNTPVTGLVDGTAAELAPGTGRIVIYGSASVTGIVIKTGARGTFDGSGNYIPATESVHGILGFADELTSGDPEVFSPAELVDLLAGRMPLADLELTEDGEIQIASQSDELLSSLSFTGAVAATFGFSGSHIPSPSYLELVENGEAVDPTSVGVFVGSMVRATDVQSVLARNLFSAVTEIDGTHLLFAPGVLLPRCEEADVRVVSPLVFSVQSLIDTLRPLDDFADDARDLQRVLSPLLSKPTLAQINDAKRVIQQVRDKVDGFLTALSNTTVRSDRSEFDAVAQQIASTLEERGLDRGLELLQACQFSDFFAATSDNASRGNRFLKASEDVGRNEFARTSVEQDQDDTEPSGTTPDENLLPGDELLEDVGQL